jgi:ATP-dependent DNA helicase RecQ
VVEEKGIALPDQKLNTLSRFHLKDFRLGQKEIIESILQKRDSLCVLPTGGGKSLCYQFPAVHLEQIVVVISPLIALMKDQVDSLQRNGIPSGFLHSNQSDEDKLKVFREMDKGGAFVLYLSPERAQKPAFHRWIAQKKIALFAIDEAHCVSQWGHDFREEYSQLKILKKIRPDIPVLALTASATPLVLDDIADNLCLKNPARHIHGFYRKNLYYQVEECDEENKLSYLVSGIEHFPEGKILVYAGTRKATEAVAKFLSQRFHAVGFYHAGLNADSRTKIQNSYAAGKIRILVATNAFGMGVDHADVRLVVHYQMPANIDSLYQEMGRAGRDGKFSTCVMLYSKKDKGLQSYFIEQSKAPKAIKNSRWRTLEALIGYAEGGECRHSEILTYYQDSQRIEACGHCDSCAPGSALRVKYTKLPGVKALSVRKKTRRPKLRSTGEIMDGMETERLSALREWRKQKAKSLDVAAFMIFSDKTLRALANECPRSKEHLLEIYGIGEQKAEAFGSEVLQRLAEL